MESLPQAVSLARALLMLARARREGVLHVLSEKGACRFAIVDGVPRAVDGELGAELSLGDELLRMGALDPHAHLQALERAGGSLGGVWAGEWLVAEGLATRGAVQCALRTQLRARLSAVLSCRGLDYRFVAGDPGIGVPQVEEPLSAPDLVLSAMRERLRTQPVHQLARVIESGRLGLTGLGRQLLCDAALWPEEAAAASLLREGAELPEILRAARGSERTVRALATWTLLGAVAPLQQPRDGRYGLLLRKSRQLKNADSAHALLDLPEQTAPELARRALRALAPKVHPDGLGAEHRPELRRACNEVMGGLLEAERRLRSKDC